MHNGRICSCWDFFSSLILVLLIASLLHGPAEGHGFRPVPTLRAGISIWWWKNFSTGGEGHVDKHLLGTHLAVFLVKFQYGTVAVYSFSGAGRKNLFLERWTSIVLVTGTSVAAGPSLLWWHRFCLGLSSLPGPGNLLGYKTTLCVVLCCQTRERMAEQPACSCA